MQYLFDGYLTATPIVKQSNPPNNTPKTQIDNDVKYRYLKKNPAPPMTDHERQNLFHQLLRSAGESEPLEYKENFHGEEELGENISALANSACIHRQAYAYIIYGVDDGSHIVGSDFNPNTQKLRWKSAK